MRIFVVGILAMMMAGCSVSAEELVDYKSDSERVFLEDGGYYELVVDEVNMKVYDEPNNMMAYNGSIPGPTFVVEQGSTVKINFVNNLDQDSSLHSHGLRLRNEYDGVPGVTQDEVKPGEEFLYELDFPDSGVYFYHPHTREDIQQDAGLYGAFLVLPNGDENEFGIDLKEDHEIVFLDDLDVNWENQVVRSDGDVVKTLMGNYGNRMFVNGLLDGVADLGEVVVGSEKIVTFVNVANVRPYKLVMPGVEMSILADDASAYQREEAVDELIIGPSERYTVRLKFLEEGAALMEAVTDLRSYDIARANVVSQIGESLSFGENFDGLEFTGDELDLYRSMEVNKTLVLDMLMDTKSMRSGGMWEMPCHQMPDGSWMGDCDESLLEDFDLSGDVHVDGIEWEDGMRDMNANSGRHNVWWDLVDEETGKKNMDIDWSFEKGDLVKIRIKNKGDSMHPMQHPIHLHGQRFLVISEDGVVRDNLAWNDTVLVPAGKTYDIVVEMSNPGDWVVHCHIPEHMEAGMMMKFEVLEAGSGE